MSFPLPAFQDGYLLKNSDLQQPRYFGVAQRMYIEYRSNRGKKKKLSMSSLYLAKDLVLMNLA